MRSVFSTRFLEIVSANKSPSSGEAVSGRVCFEHATVKISNITANTSEIFFEIIYPLISNQYGFVDRARVPVSTIFFNCLNILP